MTDLPARADRVKTIVESVGRKVIARTGNCVRIEIPTDKVVGLVRLCGEGCFFPIFREQQSRCGRPSQAFYVYDIDLAAPGLTTLNRIGRRAAYEVADHPVR